MLNFQDIFYISGWICVNTLKSKHCLTVLIIYLIVRSCCNTHTLFSYQCVAAGFSLCYLWGRGPVKSVLKSLLWWRAFTGVKRREREERAKGTVTYSSCALGCSGMLQLAKSNSVFSDSIWLAWNRPQWEYLCHESWPMLQIEYLFPRQLVVQHSPAHQYCCRNTKTNKQKNKTKAQNSNNKTHSFGHMTEATLLKTP